MTGIVFPVYDHVPPVATPLSSANHVICEPSLFDILPGEGAPVLSFLLLLLGTCLHEARPLVLSFRRFLFGVLNLLHDRLGPLLRKHDFQDLLHFYRNWKGLLRS